MILIIFKVQQNREKEDVVKEHLNKCFEQKYESHDRIPLHSCYKYRPDFVYDFVTHIAILEVDEHQHESYQCECEQKRMINLTQDFGGIPVVWIRFNPDSYKDNLGKTVTTKIPGKIQTLISIMKSVQLHKPKVLCSAIYLFYNGFDQRNIKIEEIDLSSLGI